MKKEWRVGHDQHGNKNGNWKSGRRIDKSGYILIHFPDHPNASSDGYVREHRILMENFLGRYLKKIEVVHHKNHIKHDNRLQNLELLKVGEHERIHGIERFKNGFKLPGRHLNGRWSEKFDRCVNCQKIDSKHSNHGLCNRCNLRINYKWSQKDNTYLPVEIVK